jgi:hypothetical protein
LAFGYETMAGVREELGAELKEVKKILDEMKD